MGENQELQKPPLHSWHSERGAKFTDFGGWDMPVEFDSIRQEHTEVRESAGIFDVSHMGRIKVGGNGAEELMERLGSNNVSELDRGDSHYSMITNEDGIILDDTVVYRLDDDEFVFVPNAGNDSWAKERWEEHRDKWGLDAEVTNKTRETVMFAVQGPDTPEIVDGVIGEVSDLSKFSFKQLDIRGKNGIVARTGYTGEDGFELIIDASVGEEVWTEFTEDYGVQPCGLGARDTLRTEMGFLLSGQDFNPETNPRNPYEAKVSFTVDLDTEFVGRDALEEVKDSVDEVFTGFKMVDRGIPRHGYTVEKDGEEIGEVTSGTMSPTLGQGIGLGYLPVEYSETGTEVEVVVRGESKKAKITETPFLNK